MWTGGDFCTDGSPVTPLQASLCSGCKPVSWVTDRGGCLGASAGRGVPAAGCSAGFPAVTAETTSSAHKGHSGVHKGLHGIAGAQHSSARAKLLCSLMLSPSSRLDGPVMYLTMGPDGVPSAADLRPGYTRQVLFPSGRPVNPGPRWPKPFSETRTDLFTGHHKRMWTDALEPFYWSKDIVLHTRTRTQTRARACVRAWTSQH